MIYRDRPIIYAKLLYQNHLGDMRTKCPWVSAILSCYAHEEIVS